MQAMRTNVHDMEELGSPTIVPWVQGNKVYEVKSLKEGNKSIKK